MFMNFNHLTRFKWFLLPDSPAFLSCTLKTIKEPGDQATFTMRQDFECGIYLDELAEMCGDISRVVGLGLGSVHCFTHSSNLCLQDAGRNGCHYSLDWTTGLTFDPKNAAWLGLYWCLVECWWVNLARASHSILLLMVWFRFSEFNVLIFWQP